MLTNELEYGPRRPKSPVRSMRLAGMVLAVVFGLAACSSNEADDLALDDTPPEQLYNEGLAMVNEGSFGRAATKFADVDRLHPYSEFARKSMIMQAFSWYSAGDYQNAINAGKRYTTLYPGTEDAAYAQYIIGQSYFSQIPDISRDQEMTERALNAMAELVRLYPQSEYANDATKKIRSTRDQLAGKEMEVGRFYLKKRNFIAAINRFRVVVTTYQTTRHIEEALARLTESYFSLGVIPEAQTAAAVLGHNFPDSKWYQDSVSLLQTGGYEPSENKGSWISRAFKKINVF